MENRKKLTLCLVHDHPHVLLGMKKRGFGEGRWNGFGGKVEDMETIEEAALRELKEEAGVSVERLEKHGVMDFEFHDKRGEILEVHIFKGVNIIGEPKETEEMMPKWFHIDEIPYNDMWPDDEYWVPLFLKDQKFTGRFLFGDGDIVLEKEINTIKEF